MNSVRSLRTVAAGVALVASACASHGDAADATNDTDVALTDGSMTQAGWAIVDAENTRDANAPALQATLDRGHPASVSRALLALGRIGGAEVVPRIAAFLTAPSSDVRARAAYALSVAGSDGTHPEVAALAAQALLPRMTAETDASVRAALYVALGYVGDATTLSIYTNALTGAKAETVGDARNAAAVGAALMFHTVAASGGAVTASDDLWAALFALAGEGGTSGDAGARGLAFFPGGKEAAVASLATLVRSKVASSDPQTAGWLTRAIGRIVSPSSETALAALIGDATMPASVRGYAAEYLPNQSASATTLAGTTTALGDPSQIVVQSALESIGALGASAAPLAPTLAGLVRSNVRASPAIAASALTALVAIDVTSATPLVDAALADPNPSVLRDAALTAAAVTNPKALIPLTASANVHDATYALNALTTISADQFNQIFGATAVKDVLEPIFVKQIALHDEFALTVVGYSASIYGFTDLVAPIVAELPRYTRPEFINGREAIAQAIDSLKATDQLPVLQGMLKDPSRSVALFAAAAIQDLTGQDVSAQASAQSSPSLATPSLTEINRAAQSHVVFETPRGNIVFRMLPDAPITATQFVRIADSGKYDGLPVHRVVPNFVAQGGDPHKDGFGHMAWNLPDEPAPTGQGKGYVGIATAGKDTGSCQYFIDLAENFTLNTSYSSFAFVEQGLDVALNLQQGDLVTKAYVER